MALTLKITAKTQVKARLVRSLCRVKVMKPCGRRTPLIQSRIIRDLQTLTGVLGKIYGLTLSPQRCAREKFVAVQIELWKVERA